MTINIRQEVKTIASEIINTRRDFHMHPELGFEEHPLTSVTDTV